MRRVPLRFAKNGGHFATSAPAVADFWATCVNTAAVAGPNVALAKASNVHHSLQRLDDAADAISAPSASASPTVMTHKDAVLHATVAARRAPLSLSPQSNSNNKDQQQQQLPIMPEFIYRRKTREISAEADKIYGAYREYYNHIKFRNKWEEPVIPQNDEFATELLHEAADICARIRARLDEENPSTKLRQADGSAQIFFNSPECGTLYAAAKAEEDSNDTNNNTSPSHFHRREFIKCVVLATFKDAMGFVEGLTKSKVERYFADISDFGFNPSAHVQHLLFEMLASAEVARLSFDMADAAQYSHESFGIVSSPSSSASSPAATADATAADGGEKKAEAAFSAPSVSRRALDKARQSRDNAHFCAEDGSEDKLWRDAIGKLYKAHDALLLAVAERKKNAIGRLPAVVVAPPVTGGGSN